MVVAGHICVDVIPSFRAAGLPQPGRLSEVGPALFAPGGAVSNTGLALHRLGVPVALVGKLGKDAFGEILVGLFPPSLRRGLRRVAGETTSYTLVLNPPGADRAFLHCPGANDTFQPQDVPPAILRGARHFHFGYPPLMAALREREGQGLEELLRRARSAGLSVSLDMAMPDPQAPSGRAPWPRILARLLPLVDLFMPSLEEIQLMLGAGRAPAQELGPRLREMGAQVVVLKCGTEGLRAFAPGGPLHQPALRPREFRGSTGAGDAAVAGYLAAQLRGVDLPTRLRYAAAAGAAATEAPDATSGVPSWQELTRRLEAGWETL